MNTLVLWLTWRADRRADAVHVLEGEKNGAGCDDRGVRAEGKGGRRVVACSCLSSNHYQSNSRVKTQPVFLISPGDFPRSAGHAGGILATPLTGCCSSLISGRCA
jgi:hypothetical protein